MATGMFENDAGGLCLQQSPDVPSSPASIPLPDSPPPDRAELEHVEVQQEERKGEEGEIILETPNHNNSAKDSGKSGSSSREGREVGRIRNSRKGNTKPRRIEEYDPSEPLTSSDEEEHSIQLIEGGAIPGGGEEEEEGEIKKSKCNNERRRNSSDNATSNNISNLRSTTPPPLSISSKQQATSNSTKTISPNSITEHQPLTGPSYNGKNNTISFNLNSGSSAVPSTASTTSSEEKKRPVIHFSIPTRHKLIPISSLIKRQKGGAKKDGKGVDGGNDVGKTADKVHDGDDEDEEYEDLPKISLVAEIFGDDDDDEDEFENKTEGQTVESLSSNNNVKASIGGESQIDPPSNMFLTETTGAASATDKNNQPNDTNSGRWKIVANELSSSAQANTDASTSSPTKNVGSPELPIAGVALPREPADKDRPENQEGSAEDEPEIIEIVTISTTPANRMRPLRRRPFLARNIFENGEPEVIDIDLDKDDDNEVGVIPEPSLDSVAATTSSEAPVSSPPRSPLPASSLISKVRSEPVRRSRHSSVERERDRPHFKRPHSSSSISNCEEGEIVDPVNPKKRKKDRKKKTKRRKRSKDSMSPTPPSTKSSDKRSSDVAASAASDKEEEHDGPDGDAISWRKPSKRTQNRNYRDGKPKADDNFFREREAEEKRRSSSPSKRSKSRKDKTPPSRERKSSPDFGEAEARSRSNGRGHRGRHRNRRSRSNSSSDRSRSRKKRYRRSTSRHRHGDSRSPSYITELIRSRSSNYSKVSKSRSRSREKRRARHRKTSVSRSRSHSPIVSSGHRKNRKAESLDRQQKKKQQKEKEKHAAEEASSEAVKERRREREKLREKEKKRKKEKEKPPEEEVKKEQQKEKVKEKEKKKKKKRREKSPTPVKAIVADGDSIVVSLSFAKGKTSTVNNAQSRASIEDASNDHHHHHHHSASTAENTENNNNNNTHHHHHHHNSNSQGKDGERTITPEDAQKSPTKSTTEERSGTAQNETSPSTPAETRKKPEEKETETSKVTSSGGGSCGTRSPFDREQSCNAVAADSTKTINPQQVEQYESSLSHSRRSSLSPTDVESNLQGDSLVTSTGDTMDIPPLLTDEEASKLNSSTTGTAKQQQQPQQPQQTDKIFSALARKANANLSPRFQGAQTSSSAIAESSSVPSGTPSATSASGGGSSTSLASSRPLIGNIPGLYPSNAIINSSGAAPVPPPIVIPTPPPPHPQGVRFAGGSGSTSSMLNPNVLASVASALLAVRQNQPGTAGSSGSIGDNSSMQLRHMNVLGPKSQNYALQSNRNSMGGNYLQEQGGDSPMSPNSSEGDDLFEPPIDKSINGGNKLGNSNQHFGSSSMAPSLNSSETFNPPGHSINKDRKSLFDSLFDPPSDIKKTTPVKQDKPIQKQKPKFRKGAMVPKKETIKVNTSGGSAKGELRLTDEVPTSAVELIVKQKYLKKLNRQERVVEEVKLSLKPHYSKRHVNKDEYKEILRRAVPKICHNKSGEINPGKIKELVEAYVKKFRHARKRGIDISSIK